MSKLTFDIKGRSPSRFSIREETIGGKGGKEKWNDIQLDLKKGKEKSGQGNIKILITHK